jgi:DNA-binding NarL/FixJ family response regulator
MGTKSTLLCIHRDPDQLLHLEEKGYRIVTATCGHEGLRLLMSQQVDAVVIEFHLGLLDGAVVASEIKRVKPELPIVMVCDNVELPYDAFKAVDAVVVKSDGQHFLVATIHFVLSVEWGQQRPARTIQPQDGPSTVWRPEQTPPNNVHARSSPHARRRGRSFQLEGLKRHS